VGFAINNIWAIRQGIEKFPECAYCFGVFEDLMGGFSPWEALLIDIVLIFAALVVIFFHPGRFFSFRPWFVGGDEQG
jgi:hypothetical protein